MSSINVNPALSLAPDISNSYPVKSGEISSPFANVFDCFID
jgi:hypothetical protein